MLKRVHQVGELVWHDFKDAWFRVVRRIVFGNRPRDDRGIISLMEKLRADRNWALLRLIDTQRRDELHRPTRRF